DGFWTPAIGSYEDIPFRSVTRGNGDLEALGEASDAAAPAGEDAKDLPARLKAALGDAAKDVRLSSRLTDSPVCLVADEGDMDLHLERMLAQHRQLGQESARVLEVNPRHKL